MAEVRVGILGPLEVAVEGQITAVGGPSPQRVLLRMAVDVGRPLSPDKLIEAVWQDRELPAKPKAALQTLLSRLRGLLGKEVVSLRSGHAMLSGEDDRTDVLVFERLIAQAKRLAEAGQFAQATTAYEQAESLWRGDLGEPFTEMDALRIEATRLREVRLSALEGSVQCLADMGNADAAVAMADSLVAEYPLRERLWQLLMLGMYRQDRQAEALATYQRLSEILRDDLGIDPSPDTQALEYRILTQDPALAQEHRSLPVHDLASTAQAAATAVSDGPPSVREPRPPGVAHTPSLPRLGLFVGRDQEIADVVGLLDSSRLVSLVGPGGVGKTSLATACALDSLDRFNAWFVDLTTATDAEGVLREVGVVTMGDPDIELGELASGIPADALLVLDNCEGVIDDAAELVDSLLALHPDVRVLATSREPLGLRDEQVIRLTGLVAPDSAAAGSDLSAYPATAMFMSLSPNGTAFPPHEAQAVVEVCQRLDGLPLAIELAAGLSEILSPSQILERLEKDLGVLSTDRRDIPSRQRTLAAVLASSIGRLTDDHRVVMKASAVCRGSFDLEALEAIAEGHIDGSVAPILRSLYRASLVRKVEAADGATFGLLQTIRQHVIQSGDSAVLGGLRDRHAAHFAALAETASEGLDEREDQRWRLALDASHGNIVEALEHAVTQEDLHHLAVNIIRDVTNHWFLRGRVTELSQAVDNTLRLAPRDVYLAPVLRAAAAVAGIFGRSDDALRLAKEALAESRTAGDSITEGLALDTLGILYGEFGDYAKSEDLLAEAADLYIGIGVDRYLGGNYLNRGVNALEQHDFEEAITFFLQAHDLAQERRSDDVIAGALSNMAQAMLAANKAPDEISVAIDQAMESAERSGYADALATTLAARGWWRYRCDDLADAWRDLEASLSRYYEMGQLTDIALVFGRLAHIAWEIGDRGAAVSLLEGEVGLHESNGLAPCLDRAEHAVLVNSDEYRQAVASYRDASQRPLEVDELIGIAEVAGRVFVDDLKP